MFRLVTIRASELEASRRFYETVLATLGGARGDFSLEAGPPVTRRLHVGFAAPSRAHVDAFWHTGVQAGYASDGAPGPRPEYRDDYYGGFLLDPDGNSAEAVHHGELREDGIVDHLWIRVADLPASRRFYDEEVAPLAGFAPGRVLPGRVFYAGEGRGSFSLVEGEPAAGVRLAFAGSGRELVDPDGNRIELV